MGLWNLWRRDKSIPVNVFRSLWAEFAIVLFEVGIQEADREEQLYVIRWIVLLVCCHFGVHHRVSTSHHKSILSRDRPERDSARAPASLSGRISCRSRSKINSKILLLTGAQDLLPGQDLLLEQKLLLEQEHMLEQKLHTSHSRINMLFCHVLPKLCQKRSFCFLKDGT